MPSKRKASRVAKPTKPKAVPKAPMHERMKEAWYQHPVAIVSGVLIFLGAAVSATPAIQWAVGYYQTSENAKAMEARLRAELEAYKTVKQRNDAWAKSQDLRRDTVLARNRVNDCNLLKERKSGLTPLEKNVCQQYDDELRLATSKFDKAQSDADSMSKDK